MRATFASGTVVAEFRIDTVLGEGAVGTVYAASRVGGGDRVALKVLTPELARDGRFRGRFLRESQLAASIRHPNVVATVASGEADGVLYLAMDYVDGVDLREILKREGHLELGRTLALLAQVAGALDAAHASGLVHRDVKPANVLVTHSESGERAYVCDFGLARHVSSVSSLTGERGFVGTIDYVSPEQIQGGPIDSRADVYSLGCMLYECLVGERPFARDSELSVVFAHLNEPPPTLSAARANLPQALDEVVATALAKDPNKRYQICSALVVAARDAITGGSASRPRRGVTRVAAALAAVAIASTVYLGTRGSDHAPPTITPAGIAGAKLGLSESAYERLWGNGSRSVSLTMPPGYSMVSNTGRQVAAYFEGTQRGAVELTTWNDHDRTAAGVGPCSTLGQLRDAYGSSLRSVAANTQHGKVYGYTVGQMFFAMGPVSDPTRVQAVAVFSNRVNWAGFNALNDGPCGAGAKRGTAPAAVVSAGLTKPVVYTSHVFLPGLRASVPSGRWSRYIDDSHVFALASPAGPIPSGVQINFWFDPYASASGGPDHPAGVPLVGVGRTPARLVAWLRRNPALIVSSPVTRRIAHGRLVATSVDVDLSANAPREDRSCPGPCLSYLAYRGPGSAFAFGTGLGEPVRLYLASVRRGGAQHTLLIIVDAPSKKAFAAGVPTVTRILENLRLPKQVSPA
jgi:Protein kinase domain